MTAESSVAAAEIIVGGGRPTPGESAAVVAVVAAAVEELRTDGAAVTAPRPNAWARSARGLREPLGGRPWRGFTG